MGAHVKEVFKVEISKDKMVGVAWFEKPEGDYSKLTLEEIQNEVRTSGVVYGVDEALLNRLSREHDYNYKYLVAKGKAPVDGVDGDIVFNFDPKSLSDFKPKVNEDGTVDFKNLNAVRNVKKGEVLAKRKPATAGQVGFNVAGQAVKAKKGKEARIPKGKNTTVLNDNVTLVADLEGKLEYDGHNIYINSLYNVQGDLDTSIGNIDFVGSVVINGRSEERRVGKECTSCGRSRWSP